MRILLYTHNGRGLGHVNRMSAIAQSLKNQSPDSTVILVSGSSYGSLFVPDGVDYVKLPSLHTHERVDLGRIVSRPRQCLTLQELVFLRKKLLMTLADSFCPDVMIIDHFPQGKRGELLEVINSLKYKSKFFLTLRGIIDSPERTEEHLSPAIIDYISRYFECIFSCTDPQVVKLDSIYPFLNPISKKILHVGYVLSKSQDELLPIDVIRNRLYLSEEEKLILVNFGGGQDSYHFYQSVIQTKQWLNVRCKFIVVAGPSLSDTEFDLLLDLAEPNVSIKRFTKHFIDYLNACDLYIGAAGYNVLSEILLTGTKAIVIPRHQVELEQHIHAQRISGLGYCTFLLPNQLQPQNLAFIAADLLHNNTSLRKPTLRLDGAITIAKHILETSKNEH